MLAGYFAAQAVGEFLWFLEREDEKAYLAKVDNFCGSSHDINRRGSIGAPDIDIVAPGHPPK